MSPRQLECFLEVYKQKSIKKAAEKLIISSQAVSKTINEIENELNLRLFYRTNKGLEPTTEAEYLKNHAIKIIEELKKINNIRSFSKRENTILTIYCIDGFLKYVTVKFIEDFKKKYPDILLNIIEATEKDIIEKLNKSEIDLAIVTKALENEKFNYSYLYSNKMCFVINKKNPLSKKSIVLHSDLDNHPICGKGNSYSCYTTNILKLFQNNINPKIMLETTNDSLIIEMAERNLAIGITLDYIAFDICSENVEIKPVIGDGALRNVFLVQNNYAVPKKEEIIFCEFLTQWVFENKKNMFSWNLEDIDNEENTLS